ncbi:MarR family winged helix-turn-helix transcriptional regulator [Leifsonia sp. NPDC058292]|uniref:MarR family winged helix-turn-helix transcriptional regulator n=1 Tax=Leifsonia sp. NPDC058292 TaxID=3346428 RepID=UPI0036D8BB75
MTSPLRDPLVDALAQTAFATMAVLTRISAENDLSLTQLRMFAILRDRRPRMAELAEFLGLEKSTLSGLIDRAQRRGLVDRAPSADDGRAVEVFLSADGEALAKQVAAQTAEALAPMTLALSAAEQASLRELLERMLAPAR